MKDVSLGWISGDSPMVRENEEQKGVPSFCFKRWLCSICLKMSNDLCSNTCRVTDDPDFRFDLLSVLWFGSICSFPLAL